MEAGAMDASLGHVRLTGVCWLERIRAMTYKPFKRRGISITVVDPAPGIMQKWLTSKMHVPAQCPCPGGDGGQLLWISQSLCVY